MTICIIDRTLIDEVIMDNTGQLCTSGLCLRIATARIAKGLSQTQLSKMIGVSKGAVSQWEMGQTKDIKSRNFFPLAKVLEIDPLELFYGKGSSRVDENTHV